jgi:hypothetical protein
MLDMRMLRLLLHMRITGPLGSSRVQVPLVLRNVVADRCVFWTVLSDMTGRKGSKEEREEGGSETDPDDNYYGRWQGESVSSALPVVSHRKCAYKSRMLMNHGTLSTFHLRQSTSGPTPLADRVQTLQHFEER